MELIIIGVIFVGMVLQAGLVIGIVLLMAHRRKR
jgi:hypothetical protein